MCCHQDTDKAIAAAKDHLAAVIPELELEDAAGKNTLEELKLTDLARLEKEIANFGIEIQKKIAEDKRRKMADIAALERRLSAAGARVSPDELRRMTKEGKAEIRRQDKQNSAGRKKRWLWPSQSC